MKILTVTPNSAIDATIFVPGLTLGAFHRSHRIERRPGGKANNVARILRSLGHDVVATGFVGGSSGDWIAKELQWFGIESDFVQADGESRTCYAFVEEHAGPGGRRVTEIVEPGVFVNEAQGELLVDIVRKYADWADAIVLSGSLPNGLTPAYYAALIRQARRHGNAKIALDASGQTLRDGLAAGPWIIKPNQDELLDLLPGCSSVDSAAGFERLGDRVRDILVPNLAPGGHVLISLGAQGLLAVSEAGAIQIPAPSVDVVNTVGCGDALLSGFVHTVVQGIPMQDALRYAVACGCAAALQDVAGSIAMDDVERLYHLTLASNL